VETLGKFLALFNFKEFDFDSAIRLFLSSFQIVGEGQIVDRIFGHFARVFYDSHSASPFFANVESVHVLAYAWLMIHTSFHNTHVLKKPVFEDLSKMLESQNGGGNFEPSFLQMLFNSIKKSIVPFEDSQQMNSFGHWRLLVQRQRVMQFRFCECSRNSDANRRTELFQSFLAARSDRLLAVSEKDLSAIRKCLNAADGYSLPSFIDLTVRRFCQIVLKELSEDRLSDALGFLSEVIERHGNSVKDGWELYVEVLITLFQLDLAHEDLLTFVDICDECRPVILSQRLITQHRRSFGFFTSRKSSEPPRMPLQTETRDLVARTSCHRLPSIARRFASTAALLAAVDACSARLEANVESSGLYVAFCVLLAAQICTEIRKIPEVVAAFWQRLLGPASSLFVRGIVLNMSFLTVDQVFEFDHNAIRLLDGISQLPNDILQSHFAVIEKGLALFFQKHIAEFVPLLKWKSALKLLFPGLVADSPIAVSLFADLAKCTGGLSLDYEECFAPMLDARVALFLASKTPSEPAIELQTLLLSANLDVQQWREVFNSVLFPKLAFLGTKNPKGIPALLMLKTVMNAFLYAISVLIKSPLFDSMWFRILSLTLEFGKTGIQEVKEEIPEILANALKVMQSSKAFLTPRMWDLTKSNIQLSYPALIETFLSG
jgi:hypothetical protein